MIGWLCVGLLIARSVLKRKYNASSKEIEQLAQQQAAHKLEELNAFIEKDIRTGEIQVKMSKNDLANMSMEEKIAIANHVAREQAVNVNKPKLADNHLNATEIQEFKNRTLDRARARVLYYEKALPKSKALLDETAQKLSIISDDTMRAQFSTLQHKLEKTLRTSQTICCSRKTWKVAYHDFP